MELGKPGDVVMAHAAVAQQSISGLVENDIDQGLLMDDKHDGNELGSEGS